MVTPNNEPWEVSEDLGIEDTWDVVSENGTIMLDVCFAYNNITLEQLKRMVLCFNACTGIPDGALETAIENGQSIWSAGYRKGQAYDPTYTN